MRTYSEQLAHCNELLSKIDTEEKAIKADFKAGKMTRDEAAEALELPNLWNEYRPALAVLQHMKESGAK